MLATARLRCLAAPGTARRPTSRSTGRCATTFRLCSARARKTAKDAHHQPSVQEEVREAVTNTSPDHGQPGPKITQIYEGHQVMRTATVPSAGGLRNRCSNASDTTA